MADRLKGITVEIGGDTVGLNKALKEVNQESRQLQNELSDVERLLKFNPDNAELLAQRQQLLNRQIETTSRKLTELKSVEREVQQQMERGEIGEEQFRAFQREIIATEGRLQHFQNQAEGTSREVNHSFKNMGAGLANAIAGAAAGVGIGKTIEEAINTANLDTTIDISFQVPDESRQAVKDAISTVETYGVENEAALEGVRRQWALNLDQTNEANAAVIKGAGMITKAFSQIDFTELIQETNEMATSFGISQEDALAMTNTLLRMGFPPDQLDIITEYGSQLQRAGYNAMEIQGIMAAGVQTGSWNIDVLLDGLKEGRIVVAEFGQGIDKATAAMLDGTDISTKQLEEWGNQVSAGGEKGKQAMVEVAQAVAGIDDKTKQNQIGVKIFGTLWEENGTKITDTLLNAKTWTGDAKKNQDSYNNSIKALDESPQVKLNTALSNMNTALTPLLTMVADFVAKVAGWAAENPKLAATITALTVAIGIITGIIIFLLPVIALLTAENLALAASFIPIILPIMLVVAAIAAAIAIGILIYKNWDKIMKKGRELAASIRKSFESFKKAAVDKMEETRRKISDVWDKVMSFFRKIDLTQMGKDAIQGLLNGMSKMFTKVKNKAREIANTVKEAIKDKLKMGSPSKVTEELGEFTGQGFVEGLQNTVSQIRNVSNRLAHAAIPRTTAPTTAPQQQTTNKSMSVTINSPKALDVREANKEFNRTFNKMSLMW